MSGVQASRLVPAIVLLAGCATLHAQTPATPLAVAKRFYRAPNGQLYVPAGIPLRMSIALAPAGTAASPAADASDASSVTLKEGHTSLDFGGVNVPVIADGTPPVTTLTVLDTTHSEHDGLRVLGPNPKLSLSATDALAGVAATYISIDGAAFTPLPAAGPVFPTEGVHHLRFYSVDQVGNPEKIQAYQFRLDSTPPHSSYEIAGPHVDAKVGVGASIMVSSDDPLAGVETIHTRLDDAPEQTYEKPLQMDSLPEGSHRLQFYAEDRVGNKEAPNTLSFLIDRQPPEIVNSIVGPQYVEKGVRFIAPGSSIQLAARDAVFGAAPVGYRIDDAAADTAYSVPFHLPATAGVHRLRLTAEDPLGNRIHVTVNNLYVDLTPPRTTVDFSRPFFVRDGAVVLNPASLITLNASDLESGVDSVAYAIDGGPEQRYRQPFSVAAEGDHSLTVSAVDRVGNREPTQHLRLHVQPATKEVASPAALGAKRWFLHPKLGLMGPLGLPFELRIAASPTDGAESYLANSVPQANTAPAFTAPGRNTFKIALGPVVATYALWIDAAPPTTRAIVSGAHRAEIAGVTYFGPGLKIAFTAEDAKDTRDAPQSGLWKTLYSLDASSFAEYAAPLDVFSREGDYALHYYSLDNVGNAEAAQTFKFIVDNLPPQTHLEIIGPHSANVVAPATKLALPAADNLSGVAQAVYRIDDAPVRTYSQPFAIAGLSEGPHRLHYHAVDMVGNSEEEHLWSFTVVSKVSAASYRVDGHSVVHGSTVFVTPGSTILLKAEEGNAPVYTLDSGAPQPYTKPIALPDSGNHRLSFRSVDELGNTSAAETLNVVVDHSTPLSHLHLEGPQIKNGETTLIGGVTRIVLAADAQPSGVATLEYSLNGRGWQTYTAPFTIKASGNVELSFRARNQLATVGPVEKERFAVDALGPIITVTYSAPVDAKAATVSLPPRTLLFVSAQDAPAGLAKITYKIDDQEEVSYRAPISGFAPGPIHTVTIAAEDMLGNRSQKVIHLQAKEPAR